MHRRADLFRMRVHRFRLLLSTERCIISLIKYSAAAAISCVANEEPLNDVDYSPGSSGPLTVALGQLLRLDRGVT